MVQVNGTGTAARPGVPLEGQRLLLWRLLDEAWPEPVSFDTLEAAGVRTPAMAVYELESSGHAVERVFATDRPGHRHLVGVRLTPREHGTQAEPPPPPPPTWGARLAAHAARVFH